MQSYRIGNDIPFRWPIYTGRDIDRIPFDLTGRKLTLEAISKTGKSYPIEMTTDGNIVQGTFYGKDQKAIGPYVLVLTENKDEIGMRTIDTCDFVNLVDRSYKATGGSNDIIHYDVLELSGSRVATYSGVVDSALSETSANPVENRVVTKALSEIEERTAEGLASKQDIIEDMEAIRHGASLGETSVQDISHLATKAEVTEGFASKLDKDAVVQESGTGTNKVMSQKAVTEICEALAKAIELKQEKLTAGKGISIEGGVISSTLDTNPFVVVSSLPATGNSDKIYLVPAEKQEEGNLTDEWIWNNGKWERLGSAKVDLTAYAKTEDVEAALRTKQGTISDLDAIRSGASKGATALQNESDPVYLADKPSLALKSEIPDISGKVDKVEGKELSSNDYTDEEKAKLTGLQNYDDSEVMGLIAQKANDADLANVAKTGKYEDLINEPIAQSSAQPTDGKPLWVNPDEDTEEVEVYSRQQTDALIKTRQKELTLTVKDNGNIVIGNIMGQTKEFMPATPSGDPMHYAYVAAGAEYNDTGVDIVKDAPWADIADDDADKTVVHKAGYWYLNGLGDITNEQMRYIYIKTYHRSIASNNSTSPDYSLSALLYNNTECRTNFMINKGKVINIQTLYYSLPRGFQNSICEVVKISDSTVFHLTGNHNYYAFNTNTMKHIEGFLVFASYKDYDTGMFGSNLETVRIYHIATSLNIHASSKLTSKSILYMIKNEAATSTITITLHADAYARAMANADIVAALEAHPNVSLASA